MIDRGVKAPNWLTLNRLRQKLILVRIVIITCTHTYRLYQEVPSEKYRNFLLNRSNNSVEFLYIRCVNQVITISTHFMKSHLRTHVNKATTVIDKETGEVLDEDVKNFKYLTDDKEEFVLVYSSLISLLEQELSMPEMRVYAFFLNRNAKGEDFAVSKGLKDIIAKHTNLSTQTVNNSISQLTKKAMLVRTQRATYRLNPRYAFKGSTERRKISLIAVLEQCPDC